MTIVQNIVVLCFCFASGGIGLKNAEQNILRHIFSETPLMCTRQTKTEQTQLPNKALIRKVLTHSLSKSRNVTQHAACRA